jgi:hypothetical protein
LMKSRILVAVRCLHRPVTFSVAISSAANNVVVPATAGTCPP